MTDEPRCPNCNSRSVKKSSAAYEQGISRYEGRSRGAGASTSGRIAVFQSSHSGERVSAVAEKNAPPQVDASRIACLTIGAVPAIMAFGYLINGFLGFLIGAAIAIVVAPLIGVIAVFSPPSPEQARADEAYAKQWYCRRCGERFSWGNSADSG